MQQPNRLGIQSVFARCDRGAGARGPTLSCITFYDTLLLVQGFLYVSPDPAGYQESFLAPTTYT